MPNTFFQFAATIPAGTAASNPHKVHLAQPARIVSQIRVRVPPGPKGYMGFAIGNAGVPLIPYVPTTWIVTNNETLLFELRKAVTSGTWWLIGYNTGTHTHTVYLTFGTTLPTKPRQGITVVTNETLGTPGMSPATTGTQTPTGTTQPTTGTTQPATRPTTPPVTLPTLPTAPGIGTPPTLAPPPVLPTAPAAPTF